MAVPFPSIRRDIRRIRLNTEMGQACFRFSAALLFATYLVGANFFGHINLVDGLTTGVTAYLTFSFLWIWAVRFSVFPRNARRVTSIILDQALFSFALFQGGEAVAPVLWTPVTIAIGNGLRFGTYYAKLSSLSGGIFVAFALWLSPFWRSVPLVSEGLVLSIIIIPWYAIVLAEHIARGKREMELRAAEFESASKTDALTGLLNRSGFEHALQELLNDVKSKGSTSAVMLLDLDGFKAVNDARGHSAGDEVLKQVASCLHDCLRISDKIARIGGDEFGVLVGNLAINENVERLAQKILHSVAGIQLPSELNLQLSASIGICIFHSSEITNPEAMMEVADQLMYEAKKSGKNQFKSSSDYPLVARQAA